MNNPTDIRGAVAVELLKLFPSSIGEDAAESLPFRKRNGLSFEATIDFIQTPVSVKRSKLHPAIRELFKSKPESVLIETADGKRATLSIGSSDNPSLIITVDGIPYRVPFFWMLADDLEIRLAGFRADVAGKNLPPETIEYWRETITLRALDDDEVEALMTDLRSTPQEIESLIRDEFTKTDGSISVLVPPDRKYYRGLIGDRGVALNVEEYAAGNAKAQIDRLLTWHFEHGLAQCLLFCANPRLSALIDISGRPPEMIEKFYAWLAKKGDLFSQIAGVEVAIRSLSEYPALAPIIIEIVEAIRDGDTSDNASRLSLTTNLFVLADGELARTRTLGGEPPFWRRLAATAQASMIERTLAGLGGTGDDSSEWARPRARQFFMQTLADLREEPRWLPDLMNAKQIRLELLMRVRIAALENGDKLPEGPLRTLLLGDEPHQLASITSVPNAYAHSPVEGGLDSGRDFPDDLLADLKAHSDGKAIEAKVFAGVVNFSQVFRFNAEIAGLIANLLRKVKYRLAFQPNEEISFTVIMGLASVAAAARHSELSDELRTLTRVLLRRGDLDVDAEAQIRIALLACASRQDKSEWCKAVGEWLLEIANGELDREEAGHCRAHLRQLCHAVPELWQYIAKVDAALASISDYAAA